MLQWYKDLHLTTLLNDRMKEIFETVKPHLLALVIGLAVIFAYFPQTFQGKVIDMGDINRSSATSKQTRDFREDTGIEPLWTNSQFSGMPTFQMNIKFPNNLIAHLESLTKGFLPSKLGLLFTIFIGFYFISAFLGINTCLSIAGSFIFAFSTYFIISMEAGHTGKLRAIGYIAPVMVGIIMTMRGKYLLGGALTTLFLAFSINANHFQITYYMGLMILVYLIIEGISHFRNGSVKNLIVKGGILIAAALLAIGPNFSRMWTTYDYSKETMRGGSSELSDYKDADGGGLEKDYAFSWSYGISETFTLLIPNFNGGASSFNQLTSKEVGELQNEAARELYNKGIPQEQLGSILQRSFRSYWGEQPFTSGPVYLGAIIIFLFVLGFFVLDGNLKIWLISCTILSIMLSWGRHFPTFNNLMFDYFPFYNKFRTPSMILSIASLTIPLMGILALNKVLISDEKGKYLPAIKKSFYIVGGLTLLLALLGGSMLSFTSSSEDILIETLVDYRKSIFTSSAWKSFLMITISFALLFAFVKDKIKLNYMIAGLVLLIGFDLWVEDKKYLNETHLKRRKDRDAFYVDSPADRQILQDKSPNYRVFNVSVNPFTDAMTSFHHKSIGGYHGAKLIRYQDLIDRHLSQNNIKVIDMLNTRYYITRNNQTGQTEARGNPNAMGNAWFVDNVIWAENADQEIDMLNEFEPSSDVVIDKRYQEKMAIPESLNKSGSQINLVQYQPNNLVYEASVTGGEQFAVFSEIYYEGTDNDWKVYIDGEPASHIRVNYVLRGMTIPEGNHTIEFSFEPVSYFAGEKISLALSILVLLLVVGALYIEFRKNKEEPIIES